MLEAIKSTYGQGFIRVRPATGQSMWEHVIKAGGGSKGGSGFWVIKKVMEGRGWIQQT